MLTIDVRARVQRPEALWRGQAKEKAVIREADDPLLYPERRKHLCALDDAFGVEAARIVQAKALIRLKANARKDGVRANGMALGRWVPGLASSGVRRRGHPTPAEASCSCKLTLTCTPSCYGLGALFCSSRLCARTASSTSSLGSSM